MRIKDLQERERSERLAESFSGVELVNCGTVGRSSRFDCFGTNLSFITIYIVDKDR